MMMLLLAFGGRATVAVGSWLNVTFLVAQSSAGHEEEEERHAGKGAAAAPGQRESTPVGLERVAAQGSAHARTAAGRRPVPTRIATHRDADRRNGIGTSMRC